MIDEVEMDKEKELDEFLVDDPQEHSEMINDLYMRVKLLKRDRQQLQRDFAHLQHLVNGLRAMVIWLVL